VPLPRRQIGGGIAATVYGVSQTGREGDDMTAATTFDLRKTYVNLDANGAAEKLVVTDTFWTELSEGARRLDGYLITVSDIRNDIPHWEMPDIRNDIPHWEMHPNGDEVLYLMSGKLDVLIEQAEQQQRVPLRADGPGVVIPAGAWHRTVVIEPGRLMFITWGEGTEHRPL
jgi:mannose-6-phosphate isomerase-like protein (cupin superfamily)